MGRIFLVLREFGLLIQYIGIVMVIYSLLSSLALATGDINEARNKFIRFLQRSIIVITILSTAYSIIFVILHMNDYTGNNSNNFYRNNVEQFRMINRLYPILFLVWMLVVCTIVFIKLWIASKNILEQQQKKRTKQMAILTLILALGFTLQIIYFSFEADSVICYDSRSCWSERSKFYDKIDLAQEATYPCFWIPQQLMIFFVILSYNNLKKFRGEWERKLETETSLNLQNNSNGVNDETDSVATNSNNDVNTNQTAVEAKAVSDEDIV